MLTLTVMRTLESNNEYKIKITVATSSDLPKEIFLFRKDLDGTDIYSTICGIQDIQNFQIAPMEGIAFYRKNEMTKTFYAIPALETFLMSTQATLLQLDIDYKKYLDDHKFDEEETIVINEV